MDKETCKNLLQKYLGLEEKIRSGVNVIKPGQSYSTLVDSRDIDESNNLKEKLKDCLDFLSNEELHLLYKDEDIGSKAREIVRERRNE